ncbi:MAG: type II secretion system protein GspE [Acidobacteria bacterium]|nr:MAG: type II secretion system protein GspE [Acidobacteriota bacterium]
MLLVEEGIIDATQLDEVLAEVEETGKALSRVLIEMEILTEDDLLAILADQAGYEFVDLLEYGIDPVAASLVPDNIARRYSLIPIGFDEERLIVAMSDPQNVIARDDVARVTKRELEVVVATQAAVMDALDKMARMETDVEALTGEIAAGDDDSDALEGLTEVVEDAPIVKLANTLIAQAVQDRASDIHIEPQAKDLRIRYRIDGVLHEHMRSPKSVQNSLVSRLKIMSDMDIAERRIPQDGRISMSISGREIDLRAACVPTVWGEKFVMRILDKQAGIVPLEQLGLLEDNAKKLANAYNKPYGAILATGPTGSGKTTTLYSILNVINDDAKNVMTVEDPVEFRLSGLSQIQVNTRAGLTFASALRSLVRCDPDIMMVGEIRDKETATIAIESALTGHLVLSTLHTNDAPSAATRLFEMGVEAFLVGSALDCVLAQRLARRLCEKCKEPYQPTEEALVECGWPLDEEEELPVIYKPAGCKSCSNTGYRGRVALHEIMILSEEIERMVVEHRTSEEMKKIAVMEGMKTLRLDGLAKVRLGITAIDEIMRVVV